MSFVAVQLRARMANFKFAVTSMRFDVTVIPPESLATTMLNMANAAQTNWQDAGMRAIFATDLTLGVPIVFQYERVVPAPPKLPFFRRVSQDVLPAVPSTVLGLAIGQSLPPQASVVVSLKGNTAGRRRQGRLYLPPPPEGSSDGAGLLANAAEYAVQTREVAVAVEGSFPTGADIDHIVHSLKFGTVEEVTLYSSGSTIDTQRRRRSRGG